MRGRSLGLLLSGAATFAVVAYFGFPGESPAPVSSTLNRAPASVPEPVAKTEEKGAERPKLGSGRWPAEGERWIFRFERKVNAEFQGRPWLSMKFGGRAAIEPVGMHGDNRFYLFTFEADRMEMQGQTRNQVQSLPAIRAEITPEGSLRELRFAAFGGLTSSSEEMKDAAKDLIAQWFFFEAETRLGRGETKFETLNSNPGEEAYGKRIVRYIGRPEITRLDSTHEWASAKDATSGSRVARIEGTENFTVGSSNGDFDQKTGYRWVWTGSEKLTRLTALDVRETVQISAVSPAQAEGDDPKRWIPRGEFRSTFATVAKLSQHARLGFFDRARKALAAGQDELVADIVAGVKGRSTMSAEWRTGVGLLAATSNTAAQKALVDLYRTGTHTDEKLSILAGVTAGEGKPASEWKDVLSSEMNAPKTSAAPSSTAANDPFTPKPYDEAAALREASLYALGSAIRKETDDSKRRDLEGLLWKEISDANTPSSQEMVLEAIGNSGSREFYSYVRTQSQSTEPLVRAKAVGAVRFLASDLARPILDTARTDASPVVRKAAEWSRKFVDAGAPDAAPANE